MLGKCAFEQCFVGDEEDVDVAACTSCKEARAPHVLNTIHEGDLAVRVCSERCCVALGLKDPSSGSAAAQATHSAPGKRKRGATNGQPKTKTSGGAARGGSIGKRNGKTAKVQQASKKAKGGETKVSQASKSKSSVKKSTATPKLTRPRTKKTTKNAPHKGMSATAPTPSGIKPATMRGDSDTEHSIVEALSSDDDNPSGLREEQGGSVSGSDAESDENKPKKFYFTPADDLDLLREILSIQPYAAKHGSVTARYQDITDNLNEHWGTALAMRTVKEHFFLLVKEFKTTDCEYRKKSSVAEEYAEHKQYLQDITDEMRDLVTKKNKKKADKQA